MSETVNHTIHGIIACIIFMCSGVILGQYFSSTGQSRASDTEVTRLKQQFADTEREYCTTIDDLQSRLNASLELNAETSRIVDTMGKQLGSDTGTLRDAAEYVATLRKQIQTLRDLYDRPVDRLSGNNTH